MQPCITGAADRLLTGNARMSDFENQNRSPCRGGGGGGADLALTSATPRIADAMEVFEIVIEIQLMVLYAMKIYCEHINGRDMGIFWC